MKHRATDGHASSSRRSVALVIPLYNEAEVLPLLFEELQSYREAHPEIEQVVFVDDGSADRTAELVRDKTAGKSGYLLVSFSRNFGHQIAVTAGLDFVEADAAVVLDADLQDPLRTVTRMIEKWREGYDVVYGVRKKRQGETLLKRLTARLFYRFFRWMSGRSMPLNAGDFRLIARPVLDAYARLQESRPFVRGLISWLGFNQVGIEYVREPRAAGITKYPLRKMLRLALDSITSFSDKPLRLAVQMGLFVSGLSVVGLLWALIARLAFDAVVSGWASLIISVFFLGGIQLLFLGVLGIYVRRIHEDVRGRPRYIVRRTWHSEKANEVERSDN